LIREDDDAANLDAGYVGIEKRKEIEADAHLWEVEYRVNSRKGAKREREGKMYQDVMEHKDYIGQPETVKTRLNSRFQ
jgi:hypothetical protein